ncbi:uncharacterized protein LOC114928591 [Nylanderia fulva]|uniref:uncharacterized protein LOC114928591 n=1 Tax=Nylanderia fulva TaxID=613905 RepID=UPI0010FAF56B|nr:uncharacterized protein LOC114928591 [Nylanderia fulva]
MVKEAEQERSSLEKGYENGKEEQGENEKEKTQEERQIICWDEESREEYRENTEENGWHDSLESSAIKEIWISLKDTILSSMMIQKREEEEKENRIQGLVEQKLHEEKKGNKERGEELKEGNNKVVNKENHIDTDNRNVENEKEEKQEVEQELEEEEILRAIRKMKLKKATGIDGIPMEAWIYGGKVIEKGLVTLLRRIWKEGVIPEDWRKGLIVPLYKRGDTESVENYGGISLLCTAYKIYTERIRNRMDKEVEEKGMLSESQAAFDNVDRERLWNILTNKGLNKDLIWRIRKIYEDTEATVRTMDGVTKSFNIGKGVRQGCVLSPILFNLYIAD